MCKLSTYSRKHRLLPSIPSPEVQKQRSTEQHLQTKRSEDKILRHLWLVNYDERTNTSPLALGYPLLGPYRRKSVKKRLNASKPSEHHPDRVKRCWSQNYLKKSENILVISTSYGRIFPVNCSKKNLNASRRSEHPPVRRENVKTFRWDHRLQRPNPFIVARAGLFE